MQQPPSFSLPTPKHVCKLHQSLYGLHYAGRHWHAKLSSFLISHNYILSFADLSFFSKSDKTQQIVIIVYVDDLVLSGNNIEEINNITKVLHQHFHIKNLGDLTYFLGL